MTYDDARRMIGGGARRMIEGALLAEGRTVSSAGLDRLFRIFIDLRRANCRPLAPVPTT